MGAGVRYLYLGSPFFQSDLSALCFWRADVEGIKHTELTFLAVAEGFSHISGSGTCRLR
jgi:hypothetical protein